MYDENGNVNGNGATTVVTNCSDGDAPVSATGTVVNTALATGVVTTNATIVINTRPKPSTFSPASNGDMSQSMAYYSGYGTLANGQTVNQLNRMALLNQMMNVKDPTWLQVEVCREFQRGQCSRNEQECKFAHPLQHVEVQNGRVIACYDSLKNRCTRGASVCKFLHPPQHLKEQVLNNGRNNFALKNFFMAQMTNAQTAPYAASMPAPNYAPLSPFTATVPTSAGTPMMATGGLATYNPYAQACAAVYPTNVMIASSTDAYGTLNGVLSAGTGQTPIQQLASIEQAQKAANIRFERMELAQNPSAKRAVLEKGGAPVFQPMINTMNAGQLHCQQFVSAYPSYVPFTFAGPAPAIQRLG